VAQHSFRLCEDLLRVTRETFVPRRPDPGTQDRVARGRWNFAEHGAIRPTFRRLSTGERPHTHGTEFGERTVGREFQKSINSIRPASSPLARVPTRQNAANGTR